MTRLKKTITKVTKKGLKVMADYPIASKATIGVVGVGIVVAGVYGTYKAIVKKKSKKK